MGTPIQTLIVLSYYESLLWGAHVCICYMAYHLSEIKIVVHTLVWQLDGRDTTHYSLSRLHGTFILR